MSKFEEQEAEDPVKKFYFEFFLVWVMIILIVMLYKKGERWVRKAVLIYAKVFARNPYCLIFETLHHQVL
jgi:hypothetical protein